jgi:hypothetical protein
MVNRTNYRTKVIDDQESARERYDSNSTLENKKRLKDATDRTSRSLDTPDAGAGRGTSTRPGYSRKWVN